jgi:hypothetical protein
MAQGVRRHSKEIKKERSHLRVAVEDELAVEARDLLVVYSDLREAYGRQHNSVSGQEKVVG